LCGKVNKFRGESSLRVEQLRVKEIIFFFLCHVTFLCTLTYVIARVFSR